jgi:hypothetical protein
MIHQFAYFLSRIECDARLLTRKLERRKVFEYGVSGWGDGEFPIVILVAKIVAPTRELALSQLLADCPGGVVTFCTPTAADAQGQRWANLPLLMARTKEAPREILQRAYDQMEQVEAISKAHAAWMEGNKRLGYTDDAAARLLPPWPAPKAAYAVPS